MAPHHHLYFCFFPFPVKPKEVVHWNFPTFSSCRGDAHGSCSLWLGAHMPRETLHCPDDEPLRNTLAKAILAASHTLDNIMASPPPYLPRCWLWYASSAWAISLWPAASITLRRQSSIESLSTNRAPLHRLSLSLSLWNIHCQTHTF